MASEEIVSSQPLTLRLIRPSVVVLCGPASSGKSTFAARHFRQTQVISSDRARALVCDDEKDQRFQTQAFALVHYLVEQRLSINRLCVVDSTALTTSARKGLVDLAKKYNVPCVALLFDVPLETCVTRDQSRERTVGRAAIEHQYELFERIKTGIQKEGFNQIHTLRVQDLDRVEIEVVFRPVQSPPISGPFEQRRYPAARPRQSPPARLEPRPQPQQPQQALETKAQPPTPPSGSTPGEQSPQ